jgi:hypothetical protein
MNDKTRVLLLIFSILGCSMFAFHPYSLSAQSGLPSPALSPDDRTLTFPTWIYCSEVALGDGPTWKGITIGRTTLSDLFNNNRYEVQGRRGDEIDFIVFNDTGPGSYRSTACIKGDVLSTLSAEIAGVDPVFLPELVSLYGIPDVVTYNYSVARLVLWLKRGVAADVYVDESSKFYGRVSRIVLFPFQSVEGYETRWPFNRTQLTPTHPDDPEQTVSPNKNPFDFDAIVATLTAQPPRTPSPIPIPHSSPTPQAAARP